MPTLEGEIPVHGGTLYVVATPIGNLGDLSPRAIEVLDRAAWVVAEDTRRTLKLLSASGIHARLESLHARSAPSKIDRILAWLEDGLDVAYVTDAGVPGVSDPGVALVDAARLRGLGVRTVPGPSALTAAISVAGLDLSDFRFVGFLPRASARRRALLREVSEHGYGLICYEAPGRVEALLRELASLLPRRRVALCRELTKLHEEVRRGTPSELLDGLPQSPRGEFTVAVERSLRRRRENEPDDHEIARLATPLLRQGMSPSRAARRLADEMGLSKRAVYQILLELTEGREDRER